MKKVVRENIKGLGVVLPIIIYYALFTLVPVFMMVWYSFRDYSIRLNRDQFIAFDNFRIIFTDSRYLMSIGFCGCDRHDIRFFTCLSAEQACLR